MKLFDLDSSETKQSQKVMESYFGKGVNFTKLAPAKANSMLTKVRSLISEHRSTNRLHTSEKDAGYLQLLVMERGLTARLAMREAGVVDPMVKASLTKVKTQQPINPAEQNALAKSLNTNPQTLTKALAGTATAGPDKVVSDQLQGMLSTVEEADDYSAKKARAGKDIGKPGKSFAKIAKSAGKKYGSKAAGERVAGSILKKLRNENAKVRMNGRYLTEDEVQQAQVVLAAQDMVDRIQDMLEDVTAMQFKDLPALSTSISSTVGTTEAQAFNNSASAALAALVDAIQAAKLGMEGAQGTLTGQEPIVPGEEETEVDSDLDLAAELDDVDVNVDVEEPEMNSLGRARR
jgi:hypothetical protein